MSKFHIKKISEIDKNKLLKFYQESFDYKNKDPDIFKIEEMISNIIDSRIASRQLSDCPLTMDELSKIKGKIDGSTGLLPVLRGIYHIRIEYPDSKAN